MTLAHVSEEPWSNYTKADYTPEQWHAACLIHLHDGPPTSKDQCKVPVKTPAGVLSRAGVHAAAAALAGARGGVNAPSEKISAAKAAVRRHYSTLGEEAPDSLKQTEQFIEDFLSHHGVLGMRWGHRKEPPTASSPHSTSVVPRGRFNKTKIKTTGGENHPAHPDAIAAANHQAKLKKSGMAALSNQELRDLSSRLQLEGQVKQLTTSKGQKFIARQLEQEGQKQLQRGIATGVAKGFAKVATVPV